MGSFCFTMAVVIAIASATLRGQTDLPDAPEHHLQELAGDVTIAQIDTVGIVHFPNDLSQEEIASRIRDNIASSPEAVKATASKKLRQRAERNADEAGELNAAAHAANRTLYLYATASWLGTALIIYALGWTVGWVRRGFTAT